MPIITLFSGSYCGADEVARGVAREMGYPLVADDLVEKTAAQFGMTPEKIRRVLCGRRSLLNSFTRERERCLACLRLTLAGLIQDSDLVYYGFAGHLIPRAISHVLRVCLIANRDWRIEAARKALGVSARKAARMIQADDHACYDWVFRLTMRKPWDPQLYDMVLPMQERPPADAIERICEHARRPALQPTESSRQAARDFLLAAEVNRRLVEQGYFFRVTSENGRVLITLDREVFMRKRLEAKLRRLASEVPGVLDVSVRVDASVQMETPFGPLEAEPPIKVLLVDDEREFVETLSDRLRARELQPAVAYDGEQALEAVRRDEPEVMILDLKMPGIDGMEVLRRIKRERPAVEVIILTGHGSEADERMAKELGAFAYLEKPVDLAVLTRVMKEAHQKIQRSGKSGS